MKITHNDDDTVTVRVDRGAEVYDPETGGLYSEETVSEADFAAVLKGKPTAAERAAAKAEAEPAP